MLIVYSVNISLNKYVCICLVVLLVIFITARLPLVLPHPVKEEPKKCCSADPATLFVARDFVPFDF